MAPPAILCSLVVEACPARKIFWYGGSELLPQGRCGGTCPGGALRVLGVTLAAPTPEKAAKGRQGEGAQCQPFLKSRNKITIN